MKKFYFLLIIIILLSCNSEKDDQYVTVEKTPVVLNLENIPYYKLSDYNFFKGDLKNQNPTYGVIPYQPISQLFSDYAEKKRFLWLPEGKKATYSKDSEILNLPVGSSLIKSFYYNGVQPLGLTKIIETRVMIRKSSGWIFAEYIWNQEQTDAFLQEESCTIPISWIDSNNLIKSVDYTTPNQVACSTCHSISNEIKPIGIKPQNLNSNFNYSEGSKNQLQKLIDFGYLENNFHSNIETVVNYEDASKSLNLRVRSYFDINCAHCHQEGGNAGYVKQLRFEFKETINEQKMGVCVGALTQIPGVTRSKIVYPSNISQSYLYFSLNSNLTIYRMPRIGRNSVHLEGVQLVEQWINSLPMCN